LVDVQIIIKATYRKKSYVELRGRMVILHITNKMFLIEVKIILIIIFSIIPFILLFNNVDHVQVKSFFD